ncbi:hypothetical protein ACE2AJ_11730 [Aquihabitans daechungensis]|uniref:hypothetical protein n=1 Tax=Aquihabitans daechungensis TaxID=1052257 RepID=UPI003BA08186
MFAVLVIVLVFGAMFVLTWLSSRADAAEARCEEHLRRIRRRLEIPPTSARRSDRRTPYGSR